MPDRIQQLRTRGWRKPEGAVSVARPSRWGNPFRIVWDQHERAYLLRESGLTFGRYETAAEAADDAVALYRVYLAAAMTTDRGRIALDLAKLRGRDLMCFCPLDQPCHADVLLELANPLGLSHPLRLEDPTMKEPQ